MPEEVEDDDTYPASDLEDGNTGGQTDVPDDADGDIENLVADPEPAQSHREDISGGGQGGVEQHRSLSVE